MINIFYKLGHTIRWGFVPTRYLTLLCSLKFDRIFAHSKQIFSKTSNINQFGFCNGPIMNNETLNSIKSIYLPRSAIAVQQNKKIPFVNLLTEDDLHAENPVFKLAFSDDVLLPATDYFRGKLSLDSIQVLHSFEIGEKLKESQLWHLDYGDRKSFHYIAYLNNVSTPDDGPFVFIDKKSSQKIGRSVFVRRVPDIEVDEKIGNDRVIKFYGNAGSSVFVDPAKCYHFGSRCRNIRLAIFITFNSWFPFSKPADMITKNTEKLIQEVIKLRPELNHDFIKSLLL